MTEYSLKTQKDLPLTARSQISKSSLCKVRPLLLLPGSEDPGRSKRGLSWVLQLRKSLKASKLFLILYLKHWLHFHSIVRGNLITMKVPLPREGTFYILDCSVAVLYAI